MSNLLKINIISKSISLLPISKEFRTAIFKEFTPEITTYMFPAPAKDISEVDKFIEESLKGMCDGSNLQFVIISNDTKEFLGCAGLHQLDSKTPELGIWIKKSAHGHGYGRAAMSLVKDWADNNIDYEYLHYPVDEANIPSRKIPEHFGAVVYDKQAKKSQSGRTLNTLNYRIFNSKLNS